MVRRIDIPDVLAVPGFLRARRAVVREPSELDPEVPSYVALYDIDTRDIDKSIIDLYVAARKMSQLGRLNDVLKVVEANYYELVHENEGRSTSAESFVLTQKVLCCESESERADFLEWYENALGPALRDSEGASSVKLFELYRIMEVLALGPEQIPHFLIVLDVSAPSTKEVVQRFEGVLDSLERRGARIDAYVGGERIVYQIVSEAHAK